MLGRDLARTFPDLRPGAIEAAYLLLWRQAAVTYLGCRPAFRREPLGIAIDVAQRHFLTHTAWETLDGYGRGAALPARAEPLRIGGPRRRRAGRAYCRIEADGFDLYLDGAVPAFLRPAF
jgi:hypothetical protein